MSLSLRMGLIGALLGLFWLGTWYSLGSDPRPKPRGRDVPELTGAALTPFLDQGEETIDPRSGRLALTATDAVVRAGVISLEVKRAWQDHPAGTGLLGSRWRLNWESRLVRSGNKASIEEWQGTVTFALDPSQRAYRAPSGDQLTFEKGRAVRTRADGTRETFDARGRLTERRLPGGHRVALTYDALGRLAHIAGPYGSWLQLTTSSQGRLLRIDASTGARVRYGYGNQKLVPDEERQELLLGYGYDETGALVHVDHSHRGRTRFHHAGGRVVKRSWADGSKEELAYEDAARCLRHVDAAGRLTSIKWVTDRRMEVTDPLNRKTIVESDAAGRPVQITGPTGASARFTYDRRGRLVGTHNSLQGNTRLEYLGATELPVRLTGADGTQQGFAYDSRQNLVRITQGDTVVATFAYDSDGLVKQLKTSQGLDLSFTYDRHGRRQSVTNAAGKTSRFEHDRQGNLVREIDPLGGVTRRAYDAAGRLVCLTDPAGGITRLEYSPRGLLSRHTGPGGGVTRFEYDARGRLSAETDPAGRTRRYEYSPDGDLKRAIGGAGPIAQFERDQAGNLARWTNPLGGITRAVYDPMGHLTRLTDAAGGVTRFDYSPIGLVTRRTGPTGAVTRYDYDAQGRLVAVTSSAGQVTGYEYGSQGHVARVLPGGGPVAAFEYNPAGKLLRVVGHKGVLVHYEYDVLGRRVKEQHATGRVVSYRYDDLGRLLAWTDSLGGGGSLKYDPCGKPVSLTDASGATSYYRYDPAGRLLEMKDPRGQSKRLDYTSAGQLAEVREPSGDKSRYEYDSAGLLEKLHHPGGGLTQMVRDRMGNPLRVTDPLGQETVRTYDLAGRLLTVTDPKSQTTSFAYDNAGRLLQKRCADGSRVTYRYDQQGNLVSVDDGKFPVQYTYDKLNQLVQVEYPVIKRALRYEHNAAGQRTKLVDSEGRAVNYEHDGTGRLSAITVNKARVAVFAYDARDRLTTMTYANGVNGVWEYDANDRAAKLTYASADGQVLAGWFYSYDAAGNCIKTADVAGVVRRYSYDPAGQLLGEDLGEGKTVKYSYLSGGNRGKREGEGEGEGVSYRYDKADRLLAAGAETFKHDANGNLVERHGPQGVTRYTYDAQDHLTRVVVPGGAAVAYGYAPTGQRIWRRDAKGLTYFVHDGLALTAELDEDLKPRATYLHGSGIDRPLLMTREGRQYFYHPGRLGSIHRLTDAQGKTVASYDYDAFGNVSNRKGSVANPFGYTAREYDPATGLHYYRARYYDARLGRFLNLDPLDGQLDRPLSFNPYIYVLNNPLRYTDPFGTEPEPKPYPFTGQTIGSFRPSEGIRILDTIYNSRFINSARWAWYGALYAHELYHQKQFEEYMTSQFGSRWRGFSNFRQNLEWEVYFNQNANRLEAEAYARQLQILRMHGLGPDSPMVKQVEGQYRKYHNQELAEGQPPAGRRALAELEEDSSGRRPPTRPLPSDEPSPVGVRSRLSNFLSGEPGNVTEFLEKHGGKLAAGITIADVVARLARGEDPAEIAKALARGAVDLTLLAMLPPAVSGPLVAIVAAGVAAKGYHDAYKEWKAWRADGAREQEKKALQEKELPNLDAKTAALSAELARLERLKDKLVTIGNDAKSQGDEVAKAAKSAGDKLTQFYQDLRKAAPKIEAAAKALEVATRLKTEAGQSAASAEQLEAEVEKDLDWADAKVKNIRSSGDVTAILARKKAARANVLKTALAAKTAQSKNRQLKAIAVKLEAAKQAIRQAETSQQLIAKTAESASNSLDTLKTTVANAEKLRNDLDAGIQVMRNRIALERTKYPADNAKVNAAFGQLSARLKVLSDTTTVDVRQYQRDAEEEVLSARKKEQIALDELNKLEKLGDCPTADAEADRADTARTLAIQRLARSIDVPAQVRVPNVVGATYGNARARLQAVGLVLRAQGGTNGTVRSQTPVAGTQVAKGSTVNGVFQAPVKQVRVPNLVGMTLAQASATLARVGLRLAQPAGFNNGKVSSQTPAAGTLVARGRFVSVRLQAPAPDLVAVPNVVNLTTAQARARLAKVGLVGTLSINGTGNIVARQDPPAGSRVPRGLPVGLYTRK